MMNCQQFHDQLFDYLDGGLPERERTTAEEHLGHCADCQRAMRAHQALMERFKGETDSLAASPELTRRIQAALAVATQEPAPPLLGFWRRLAWPMGMAAAIVLTGGLILYFSPIAGGPGSKAARMPVSVRLSFSYCEPAYTFRREKNGVVDALICAPRVVEENLSLSLNQKPVPQTQEKKTSL